MVILYSHIVFIRLTIDMYVCTLCRGMVQESVCQNCAFLGDMVAAHTCCGASYI